tara:strand:- start:3081 stop:3749 length:669 start_codon:yes stop_codon:yes gene_type:complete
MLRGNIWNDGFNGTILLQYIKSHNRTIWYDYAKRNPDISETDVYKFATLFAQQYAIEKVLAPRIANYRRQLVRDVSFPPIFPGLSRKFCPVTMVGISRGFGNTTHNDSCVNGVTETIFWANKKVKSTSNEPVLFMITTARLCLDIGARPCMLFLKGNEMHGTVPTRNPHTSIGTVLITKRRCVQGKQKFQKHDITNMLTGSEVNYDTANRCSVQPNDTIMCK